MAAGEKRDGWKKRGVGCGMGEERVEEQGVVCGRGEDRWVEEKRRRL